MIGEVTFGVIGLLFLFADIRTFSSTFQQTFFGNASTTQLAIMATSVFLTSFLALLVSWRFGPTRSLGISSLLFVAATFLCTTSRNNAIDLVLSVIALAAGFWWLAFLHSARAGDTISPLARALPIAFASDVALRAVFRTEAVVDLPWSAAVGIVLAAVLVCGAAGLVVLAPQRQWTSPGLRGAIALLCAPTLIFVAESGATNGAQVAQAGLGLPPEPLRATQIGQLVVGVGLAAGALVLARYHARAVLTAVAVLAGAALLWMYLPYASLLGAVALAGGSLAAGTALFGGPLHASRSPAAAVVALSVGWLVFVGCAFGFYAFWAFMPAVYAATAIAAVGVLIAPSAGARLGRGLALATALLAIGAPLAALLTSPPIADLEPPHVTFRFMTYNIHQGYNAGQIPALDVLVDTIAKESPDVVCLQEVVRGWMIDDQHDALSFLSERLGMRYAWLSNVGDLYGNAILSRFPITDVSRVAYAREPGVRHQPRGALFARIGDVLVGCTHLDEFSDSSIVRQEQVRTIIRAVSNTNANGPLIIAGDLNAVPGDIEIRLLGEFGLDDLGIDAGPTTTGDDPPKRIDYVWGRGVIGAQAHTIPVEDAVRASDHRPLIVNVTVRK